MDIIKLCGIAIIAAIFNIVLRREKGEFALAVSAVSGVMLLLCAVSSLAPALELMRELSAHVSQQHIGYFNVMIKALGVSVIVSAAADSCRDMGEAGVAKKLEFAGKAQLLLLALPLVRDISSLALELAS